MAATTPPERLRRAHWAHLERLRTRSTTAIVAMWRRQGFDAADIDVTVQMVLASQRAIVAATDAGLALQAAAATGTTSRPIGLNPEPLIGRVARNGVSLEEVYSRPRVVARQDGFDRGVAYLRATIALDGQLAQRRAAHAVTVADRRVVGWRRQVNPVPGGQTCGLCIAASTQTYRKENLLPLHSHCRCTVYGVYSTDPVGMDPIDRERLDAVYARTDGMPDRSALGKVRLSPEELPGGIDPASVVELAPRVDWHSELGELLTGARHDSTFTL